VGRTGKLHSYEHFNFKPDILVIAKGIGGGLPLGAVLGDEKVAGIFNIGMHGSTFGGNPVAASCGCVIYDELSTGLLRHIKSLGDYLFTNLVKLNDKHPSKIAGISGLGLMLGVKLKFDGQPVVEKMLEQNILVNCTNINIIRLLPPYLITESEVDLFIEKFDYVLSKS
jgi:acetylornithine/succinyldiaminopimelate/putrescine aminotransferase